MVEYRFLLCFGVLPQVALWGKGILCPFSYKHELFLAKTTAQTVTGLESWLFLHTCGFKAQYNEIIVTEQEHYLVAFGRTELGWGLVCEYGEALKNQLFIFDEIPKQSIYAN